MVGVFKASYAVTDTNVVHLVRPGAAFVDLLTEVLRNGTRALLARRSRPIPPSTPTSSPMMAGNARCAVATYTSARSFWDWTG
jgi:hypothetical protein